MCARVCLYKRWSVSRGGSQSIDDGGGDRFRPGWSLSGERQRPGGPTPPRRLMPLDLSTVLLLSTPRREEDRMIGPLKFVSLVSGPPKGGRRATSGPTPCPFLLSALTYGSFRADVSSTSLLPRPRPRGFHPIQSPSRYPVPQPPPLRPCLVPSRNPREGNPGGSRLSYL